MVVVGAFHPTGRDLGPCMGVEKWGGATGMPPPAQGGAFCPQWGGGGCPRRWVFLPIITIQLICHHMANLIGTMHATTLNPQINAKDQ